MRRIVSLSFCAVIAACGPSSSTGVRGNEFRGPTPARNGGAGGGGGASRGTGGVSPIGDEPATPPSPDLPAPVVDAAMPPSEAAPAAEDVAPTTPDVVVMPRDLAAEQAAPDVIRPPDVMMADAAADSAPAACPPAPAADEIVSTFEDGSLKASAVAGREANAWYLLNINMGATAMITVTDQTARCGSRRFLRFTGMASAAQLPIARVLMLSGSMPFYDARARGYQGVRLSLRAGVASRVGLKLPDRNTSAAGGVCVMCSDHFGAELEVGSDWKTFTVPFSSLKQMGVGDPQPASNPGALFGIEIVVRAPAVFDLSVDDVVFYR